MYVDVSGRRMYLDYVGAGEPTVVMDAGLSDASNKWGAVPAAVAQFTRVCVYDRAGLGQSDPGPQPHTSSLIVDDLHALLRGADIAPPYVLVGHSFGGQNVRLFASRYPDEIAGLVLVDAGHEHLLSLWEPEFTPEAAAEFQRRNAENREGVDLFVSASQLRDAASAPDVPVIVLRRGLPDTDSMPPDWPIAAFWLIWQDLSAEVASRFPKGQVIVAEQSGHYIQRDQPEVVTAAIKTIVQTTRH